MNRFKGFLSLLASGIILGSFGVYIRLLDQNLGAYQQIAFRNAIAFLFVLGLIFILRRSFALKGTSKLHLFGYAVSFPISIVLFTVSILETKVITTIFGLYLGSLLTSLVLGMVIFKEKITPIKIVALGFVLVGLVFYVWPFSVSGLFSLGLLLGIGAGIAEAVANSFRKYLGGKVDRFVLVSFQALGALLISAVLIVFAKEFSMPSFSVQTWLVGLWFGLMLVSMYYLTLVGFANFDLNLGTIVLSTELLFGPIFAIIFFREFPSVYQAIGAGLIMLAIVILNVNLKLLRGRTS